MNTILQRFGRRARRAGLKASGVFFVESRFTGPKKLSKTADPNESGDSDGDSEIVSKSMITMPASCLGSPAVAALRRR